MRNAAVVLALTLHTSIAGAAMVAIARPHIVYRSPEGVASACKAPKRACTTVDTEFYCGCALSKDGWALTPHIMARPSIYTTSDAFLQHEREHIVDIHKSLDEYVSALVMNSFPDERMCRDFVAGEAAGFSRTMKSIERASIIKRDGVQFAGPPVERYAPEAAGN